MHWKQATRGKNSGTCDPSLLTGVIAKLENTTIPLYKSKWKNRAKGLKTEIPLWIHGQ